MKLQMEHGNLHKRIITEKKIRFGWSKSNEEIGIRISYGWKWIINRIQYLLNNILWTNKPSMERIRTLIAFGFVRLWFDCVIKTPSARKKETRKRKMSTICHYVRSHCCRSNGCSVCYSVQRSHSQNHINKQTKLIIIVIIKDGENNTEK